MLAGSGDALLLGAGKQPQKVRHMKKKQSKKSEIPLDPVATIYDKVFYLLRYLWTMAPQRLAPPIAYETDSDGELLDTKATVDHCWKEFDRFMNLYLKTFQAFTPILQEIRSLRQDPIVCESVFRTFADKQRESASLDEAIEFVEKGFKLFRRLIEEGGVAEVRTEEVFYRQVGVCSRIWNQHDYDLLEIKDLESGLKWELAAIENRRNPIQSTSSSSQQRSLSKKKSLKERSNRELLIAILLDHHRYKHPSGTLNQNPISTKEAIQKLGKSSGTLSRTWKEIRTGLDYEKYCRLCGKYSTLEDFLRMIDSKEGYLERTNNQEAIDYSEE